MTFEFTLYDALLSIDVPADKARAVIDALEHDMGSTLATKQDIASLSLATKQDIASLALATKRDIELLRQELKQDIELLRQEVRQDIELLRQEVKQDVLLVKQDVLLVKQQLEHRIDLLQSTMTIRLGSILVVAMSLLFAAVKLI